MLTHGSLDSISDRAQHSYHSDRKPDRALPADYEREQFAELPQSGMQIIRSRTATLMTMRLGWRTSA